MPSYMVTVSAAKAARVLAALDAQFAGDEQYDSLTDRQKYLRWLKGQHTELVLKNEHRVAQGAVVADPDIADVT